MGNSKWTSEYLAFVGLVAVGIALRLCFRELPNFAPVAALALFSGYFFRSRVMALAVPLTIMLATDVVIGSYQFGLMVTVYGMLALPVAARGMLRRVFRFEQGRWTQNAAAACGLLTCGMASSILFFLVTNFAAWLVMGIYERSWNGLLHCYVQGFPFFRYTLVGDLGFAVILFTGYAIAKTFVVQTQPQAAGV